MKKVIVVGDVHLDHRKVKSRIDNYMESSLLDFKETLKIAKAQKADAIIYLGDIFEMDGDFGYRMGTSAFMFIKDRFPKETLLQFMKTPTDFSIIGYDNIRMASLIEPKLTSVSWPVYKMGLISARILIDEIEKYGRRISKCLIFSG